MTDRLDSAVVRRIIEIGTSDDPLMLLLVTYLGAAFHASLFGGVRLFMVPHQEKWAEIFNGPPTNAYLQKQDLGIVNNVSHQLELVYRLAVFDSFLNNLASYALAARPSKAIRRAQMQVSVLLGKTRAEVINEYIARRTKSLSRENFGTRIQALREITEADFRIPRNDLDGLKRLGNLRNAIVHEGAGYQFTVDNDLRIHSHAEAQTVTMAPNERLSIINRVAASIYEQYVTQFIRRDLNELEQSTIAALSPPTGVKP
jgi:hypothetical protein